MKTSNRLLIILAVLCFQACKKDKDESAPPEELSTVISSLATAMDSVDDALVNSAAFLVQAGVDTTVVRGKLAELLNAASFIKESAFITPQGILQLIEPPAYYQYQGSDLSLTDTIVEALAAKLPILTNVFSAVEGFPAVADIHPIFDGTQVLGGIEALFTPSELLGGIISPLLAGQPFEIWVMQNNGKMLWNQDDIEIGLNIFSDPYYDDFPSLREAADKIASGTSGEVSYSFYQALTQTVVKKNGWWDTYTLHGTEWKVVWMKPE